MESLAAGLDLEMPGPQVRRVAAVMTAVREGQLDEAVLGPLFAQIQSKTQALFGGGEQAAIGLDMMEMLGDMPVVSVLMFLARALDQHPEDIVAGMLAQVHGKA